MKKRSDHIKTKLHAPEETGNGKGLSVDYISDIHTEWWNGEEYDYAAHKKNDTVIVNGDLMTDTKSSLEVLKKIAGIYETVLFIDGNHEYRTKVENADGKASYPYNFDFKAVQKILHEGIAKIPNVVYLADKPFVKDGVAIIGRNGHWDYKIVENYDRKTAISEGCKKYLMTDFKHAATFEKLARQDYYGLRDELIRFSNDPTVHSIVVVTHTVPRAELLNWSDEVTPAKQAQMGSSLMRNLLQYDTNNKVAYWLFGHQHAPKDQFIGRIRYHENPRGYHYDGSKDYKPSTFKF